MHEPAIGKRQVLGTQGERRGRIASSREMRTACVP